MLSKDCTFVHNLSGHFRHRSVFFCRITPTASNQILHPLIFADAAAAAAVGVMFVNLWFVLVVGLLCCRKYAKVLYCSHSGPELRHKKHS